MTALLVAAVATTLVGGCATEPARPSPEVERSRAFEGLTPGAAFERTLEALRDAGLDVARADPSRGVITAGLGGFAERGWAECPLRRVTPRDDTRRARRADRVARHLELTASVREAGGGATVTLDADIEEEQRNSFTNLTFRQDCRSTGALERRILDSIGAGTG